MAGGVTTFESLTHALAKGQAQGVYLLHGDEGYYIDRLLEGFEGLVAEEDREFDLHICYGAQSDPMRVIDLCRQWPVMSDRQVVILKEAQSMNADKANKLARYVLDPTPSTVLVIAFRGESAKGKDLIASVKSKGTVFESKKVSEYNIAGILNNLIKQKDLNAEIKAVEMLRDYIGTDISRLYNEVNKLAVIVGDGGTVTPDVVERNIGISKDYNNFELVDALAVKDAKKVFMIADYFKANPKTNPLVMTTSAIFAFFCDLLVAQYTPDKSDRSLQQALKLRAPWMAKRYLDAMRKYKPAQVIEIIGDIRRFDSMSKGVDSRQSDHRLFRELLYRILTARGVLPV